MESIKPKTKLKPYYSLIGGLIIHIVLGSMYITGNITVYMSSYFQHSGINITTSDLGLLVPAQVFGKTIGTVFGPVFSEIFNPKIAIGIGCTLLISSVALSSIIQNYFLILLFYGFINGLGIGISYTVPILVSWGHFPNYKGRVTGFILTGFGLGTSIFNLVSTHLINPDNEHTKDIINGKKYFSLELANRFPTTLMELSLIYLILTIIGIILIDNPKISHKKNQSTDGEGECPSLLQALKTREYWLLMFMIISSLTPGFYIISNYKIVGKEFIHDDQFLALVGSVSALVDGSSRLIWGSFMDNFSFKAIYGFGLIIQASALFAVYFVIEIRFLYMLAIAAILGCKGGQFVLFTTVCSKVYGKSMGSKVFGMLTYGVTIASIVSYVVHIGIEHSLGLECVFIVLGGMSIISFAAFPCFREKNLFSLRPLELSLIESK